MGGQADLSYLPISSSMPFLKGRAALRRTQMWLEKGDIYLRNNIKIVACNFDPPHVDGPKNTHEGLDKFIFWHLPQLKYKNPNVQFVTFKYITPNPWLKFYSADERSFVVDCDGRSREDIH